MTINDVPIADEYAEAFDMVACRVIVTAATSEWARIAALSATGYSTSIIGCDCEAGIERVLDATETPDGRPGMNLLFFARSVDDLENAVANRIGQCVLTCATTACFSGLSTNDVTTIRVGGNIRMFGDGFESQSTIVDRNVWRIPVMDGEFICEDEFGIAHGISANFLILGESQSAALNAAEAAVAAVRQIPNVILPFPGGVVRSGSKVGSRYPGLKASTNQTYCPTLSDSALPRNCKAVYEVVINGLTRVDVEAAMRAGIQAVCQPGIIGITAGNYGGKLGSHKIHLRKLFA